jgi:hypothetical protein
MNPKIIRFSPAFLASRRPNSQIFSFGLLPLVGKTMPLSFLRALRRVASAPGIYGVVNPETFLYLWSYRKTQSLAPDIVLNPLGYTQALPRWSPAFLNFLDLPSYQLTTNFPTCASGSGRLLPCSDACGFIAPLPFNQDMFVHRYRNLLAHSGYPLPGLNSTS